MSYGTAPCRDAYAPARSLDSGTLMPGIELGEIGPKLNSTSTNIGYCRSVSSRPFFVVEHAICSQSPTPAAQPWPTQFKKDMPASHPITAFCEPLPYASKIHLRFTNVRIPMDRMFSKYSSLTPDGEYVNYLHALHPLLAR